MAGKGQKVTERDTFELFISLNLKCGDGAWVGSHVEKRKSLISGHAWLFTAIITPGNVTAVVLRGPTLQQLVANTSQSIQTCQDATLQPVKVTFKLAHTNFWASLR